MKNKKPKLFLTARWENLIIASYKVDQILLEPYLPQGLEPDTIDGDAFVSLVAFNFNDTRVKGFRVPFHVNFPEINMRFYVKTPSPPNPSPKGRGESYRMGSGEDFYLLSGIDTFRRGVVFIREIVPKFFIARIANLLFNENYISLPMINNLLVDGEKVHCSHYISLNGKTYSIRIETSLVAFMPRSNSTEHFFKEHEWGFGRTSKGQTLVYRVEHPVWEAFPVTKFELDFDFGEVYGNKWNVLNREKPYNIAFARGSWVKVYSAEKL